MNFDELFDDVYPRLYRYCLRLTADPDVAEDATQEAFVRLLDRRVRGDLPGLRSWLFRVATHLIRDRVRVETNRARLLEANAHEVTRGDTPADLLERDERIATARRALQKLSDRDRTLLLLREEGFAYKELAEVIGVEPSSVGTLLARARRRFTEALGVSPE